jgi:hypothetical protein
VNEQIYPSSVLGLRTKMRSRHASFVQQSTSNCHDKHYGIFDVPSKYTSLKVHKLSSAIKVAVLFEECDRVANY